MLLVSVIKKKKKNRGIDLIHVDVCIPSIQFRILLSPNSLQCKK